MALSRAHLAEENRTHFPFASMFLCMFFLEFLCRASGKGWLVPHYIYTRAISSGEISRVVWTFSVKKEYMGAVADAGNVLGHPLCITQNKNKPFFKRQHFLEFSEHVHVSKIGI